MKPHEADELINRIRSLEDSKWRFNKQVDTLIKELNERLLVVLSFCPTRTPHPKNTVTNGNPITHSNQLIIETLPPVNS